MAARFVHTKTLKKNQKEREKRGRIMRLGRNGNSF